MNGLLSYDIYKAEHRLIDDNIDWIVADGNANEKLQYILGVHDFAETLIKQIGECNADHTE